METHGDFFIQKHKFELIPKLNKKGKIKFGDTVY
jgi:hypothetical protein